MRQLRFSWIVVAAVAVTIASYAPLRRMAQLSWSYFMLPPLWMREGDPSVTPAVHYAVFAERLLRRLGTRPEEAWRFVDSHCPNDPHLLLGAACLTEDEQVAVALSRRAVNAGGGGPAWAVYVGEVLSAAPEYQRLGNTGVNPADPKELAYAHQELAESKLADRLAEKAAAAVLEALHGWQRAERNNGLPVALEAYYLYGLHRDAEALVHLEQAVRSPRVSDHEAAIARTVAALLTRLGMPAAEAIFVSDSSVRHASYAKLRECARLARYEGYQASMEGRSRDALRWWQVTQQLGLRVEDSADSYTMFLVGSAIQSIGAGPAWKLHKDSETGLAAGPLREGRLFYGPAHEFYVAQVGEKADTRLRDQLVRSLVRGYSLRGGVVEEAKYRGYAQSLSLLTISGLVAGPLAAFLLLYFCAGTWGRQQADAAASRSLLLRLLLIAWVFLGIGVAARIALGGGQAFLWTHFPVGCALLSLLLGFLGPLVGTVIVTGLTCSRPASALASWRGNVRHFIPALLGVGLLVYVACLLASLHLRNSWVQWRHTPGLTEMAILTHELGDKWTNPTIPPDAWRAERPPVGRGLQGPGQ